MHDSNYEALTQKEEGGGRGGGGGGGGEGGYVRNCMC